MWRNSEEPEGDEKIVAPRLFFGVKITIDLCFRYENHNILGFAGEMVTIGSRLPSYKCFVPAKVAADRNIPWYGDALVRFKRERVIDRTTFKTADTLNTWYGNNSARAAMVNNPTITGISNISRQTYDRIRNAESLIHDPSDWVDAVNNGEYFELQYHGHLTMDDVASITFHGSLPSQSVLDELKRRGIKIYKLNGGRVNEL